MASEITIANSIKINKGGQTLSFSKSKVIDMSGTYMGQAAALATASGILTIDLDAIVARACAAEAENRYPAVVALANKLARIVWVVLRRGEEFNAAAVTATAASVMACS